MRTALLAAVGHDLRTPLSGVKAAVSSLRQSDVTYTRQETLELLATIEESTDRLQNLVENLLASSRLEAGVVSAVPERIALIEVLNRALLATTEVDRLAFELPDDLPDVVVDLGLAERVIANRRQRAAARAARFQRGDPGIGGGGMGAVRHRRPRPWGSRAAAGGALRPLSAPRGSSPGGHGSGLVGGARLHRGDEQEA